MATDAGQSSQFRENITTSKTRDENPRKDSARPSLNTASLRRTPSSDPMNQFPGQCLHTPGFLYPQSNDPTIRTIPPPPPSIARSLTPLFPNEPTSFGPPPPPTPHLSPVNPAPGRRPGTIQITRILEKRTAASGNPDDNYYICEFERLMPYVRFNLARKESDIPKATLEHFLGGAKKVAKSKRGVRQGREGVED